MTELYAKSGKKITVSEHCRDVREAGDAVWEKASADLATMLPGLPDILPKARAAAELLHDLLKANSSFQGMLAGAGKADRQPVRHEVLAAAFLTGDGALAAWFADLIPDAAVRWAVVWAVAGHHFKMGDPYRGHPLFRDAGAAPRVTLHLSHPGIRTVLSAVGELFGGTPAPALADQTFTTHEDELRERIDDYAGAAMDAWDEHSAKPGVKTLAAVLKALLAAADAAGSAVTESGARPAEWVREHLGRRLTPADIDAIVKRDLEGREPRDFQKQVAASDKRVTVVAAGCGNGKTTAAYLWAKRWASGKKLFFTYPTTGTATAGFTNYLHRQKDIHTDLIHGRSAVDLAAMRANPTGDEADKKDEQLEAEARFDSLRAWSADVVTCTVDTVLGLMQCQRRGMYSFPAFAAGAFVFDEIHAYDAKLWGGLLRFLKEFPGVPALLMSASIPPGRQKQLFELLGDRAGDIITGDEKLEERKRYRLEKRDSVEGCWKEVEAALTAEKKVLWVCNTVGDAMAVADLARKAGHTPIVYHSRFRYRDRAGDGKERRGRQNEVVDKFTYKDGKRVHERAALVIATQVCEMSLDISADVLVTAECPLPALVQRLGRLNRYAATDDPWPCHVYPFTGLPYNEDPKGIDLFGDCRASMDATRKAVSDLAGEPCSQKDLAERLKTLEDTETPETYAALFDDGWVTEPMPVRDGDASVTVIWENDLPEIAAALGANRSRWAAGKLAPWTIPMNLRKGLKPFTWDRAGPYPIAPADILTYSEEEGARWAAGKPQ